MENRYPMQARGPPIKVNMLPHMPGIPPAASGIDVHRSGLRCLSHQDCQSRMQTLSLEIVVILSPYFLVSVDRKDWYEHCLTLADSVQPVSFV